MFFWEIIINNEIKKHRATIINIVNIPYWTTGLKDPCGYINCKLTRVSHKTFVTKSMIIIEKRFAWFPLIKIMFTAPNSTKHKEKNTFMFRTAIISSVASGLMYEYQFHILGTKKCHNPKQIVIILPAVVRILISINIIYPPKMSFIKDINFDIIMEGLYFKITI